MGLQAERTEFGADGHAALQTIQCRRGLGFLTDAYTTFSLLLAIAFCTILAPLQRVLFNLSSKDGAKNQEDPDKVKSRMEGETDGAEGSPPEPHPQHKRRRLRGKQPLTYVGIFDAPFAPQDESGTLLNVWRHAEAAVKYIWSGLRAGSLGMFGPAAESECEFGPAAEYEFALSISSDMIESMFSAVSNCRSREFSLEAISVALTLSSAKSGRSLDHGMSQNALSGEMPKEKTASVKSASAVEVAAFFAVLASFFSDSSTKRNLAAPGSLRASLVRKLRVLLLSNKVRRPRVIQDLS
jgi:hypothetical protein